MMALCIPVVAILTHLRENMKLVAVQIRGWPKQPEVWRFVGLASTVVGLLCYALSSAFNHLFEKWYSWKISLYIVVSVFICLLILFPGIWQRFLISPRFKTHSPFWVVSFTSVYSFYFDKAVSGKSDVYNLISCAAFSIMSLSLSRRTHCGLEKDLLYFFLGVLIVRLMMIKRALGILGVCFGYFLHYLCFSGATPVEYVELQSIVIKCDPSQASSMSNQLRTYMKELKQVYLNVTFSLFEFVPQELGVPEQNYVMEALPSSLISDLQKTVKVMMAAGLKKECYDVYIKRRRKCLVDCIINKYLYGGVNIEKEKPAEFGIEVHMIRRLAEALKVSLGILYYGEQRLFDGVFSGFSDASYPCLLQICEGPTVKLLDLIDAVVSESPSLASSRDCGLSFQLDKRTGKKCYMVSARDLSISWVENPDYWSWTTVPESRFQQVAELLKVCWFDILGTISTLELSSNTHYAAYLVFNMIDPRGFGHCLVELSVGITGGRSSTKNVCLDPYLEESELDDRFKGLQRPNVRNDGWLEIDMGEFFNSDRGDEVYMRACETQSHMWKRGFLLEGIEVRPKMSDGT